MLYNGFIVTSDQYLQPCYRISPFKTDYLVKNNEVINTGCDELSVNRYLEYKSYVFTSSGREAINIALQQYRLNADDIITILTTSGNHYISSCVTKEIEKYCKWSRKIEPMTKVIFVNHEFGFAYENLSNLKKYNIPIIEDCAHSFASQNAEESVGKVGDYVIYSLPKFFPVQFGGILRINNNNNINIKSKISNDEIQYLKKIILFHLPYKDEIIKKRKNNYSYLSDLIKERGFGVRFKLNENCCPGVFIFKSQGIDLSKLKEFMQHHGVECSVFYGEESFFLPVNQSLGKEDLDYFVALIDVFISELKGAKN